MKIEYSQAFQDFVKTCLATSNFVGTGNPNAKILIVGKEAAISPEKIEGQNWYNRNAKNWDEHITKGTCECLEYPVEPGHELRHGWGRNTWSKYQQLVDQIFDIKTENFYVNFLQHAFTTEINDSPNKRTSSASKEGLSGRKALFKESRFFREFPVVILACSDYIHNHGEIREIDDIFQVKFDGHDPGKYHYSKGNWFYTHHNEDHSRLVIHTRQLSSNVNNSLISDMASITRAHLEKVNPEILKETK